MAAIRDFTLTFRRLCDAVAGPEGDEGVRVLFADPGAYDSWAGWRRRLEEKPVSGQAFAAVMGHEDVKTTIKYLHPNTSGSAHRQPKEQLEEAAPREGKLKRSRTKNSHNGSV